MFQHKGADGEVWGDILCRERERVVIISIITIIFIIINKYPDPIRTNTLSCPNALALNKQDPVGNAAGHGKMLKEHFPNRRTL